MNPKIVVPRNGTIGPRERAVAMGAFAVLASIERLADETPLDGHVGGYRAG